MKKEKNYLDFVPVRNSEYEWNTLDTGIIEIKVINKGFYNKIAQKFFKAPKESYIKLDEYGSEVWKCIDDKRDIGQVGENVRSKFSDDDKVFYERLVRFFNILKENKFVEFREK